MDTSRKTFTTLTVVLTLTAVIAQFGHAAGNFPHTVVSSDAMLSPEGNLLGIACIAVSLLLVVLACRLKSKKTQRDTDAQLSAKMAELLPEWHSGLLLQDIKSILN